MLTTRRATCLVYSTRLARLAHTAASEWRSSLLERNAPINAFVHVPPAPLTRNDGELSGVSVAVKDNICTSSMPTTASSKILDDFTSPFDATVVDKLLDAGASIIGKVNCDEFGMGSLNIHTAHGPVINPFVPKTGEVEKRSAGGSSGGSAAAVAAGLCDAALGTDTGGSIRLPAAYCGVVGLKPSYGIVSRRGVISYADSLDCVGVLARDVGTTARVFDVISEYDARDPTAARPQTRSKAISSAKHQISTWTTNSTRFDGVRIGIPQEYFPAELPSALLTPVRKLLATLREKGAVLVPVSLPATRYALSAYYVLASAEASSCLARYDGIQYGHRAQLSPDADRTRTADIYAHTRSSGFGPEVRKRILLGAYALSADAFDNYFLRAQRVRQRVRKDFDAIFAVANSLHSSSASSSGVDILLHPSAIRTAPALAPPAKSDSADTSGLDAYVQDVLTVPASLAGIPALALPVGAGEDGWPVGVSLVGQWGCEKMLLELGSRMEQVLNS